MIKSEYGRIIDGTHIASMRRKTIKNRINALQTPIGLAVILIGDDEASHIYVRNKIRACKKVGIQSHQYTLPQTTSESKLIEIITQLNDDRTIHGILVQLPLPAHIDTHIIMNTINPQKDVDGFHYYNVGALSYGNPCFIPCTPLGIVLLLHYYDITIAGAHVVIIGASTIVGRPIAQLLLAYHATITIAHKYTQNLASITNKADIVISATGVAHLITEEYISSGTVVLDVGFSRDDSGILRGDVHFEKVHTIASYITPVPGGVGPMTIVCLLENTLQAYNLIVYGKKLNYNNILHYNDEETYD